MEGVDDPPVDYLIAKTMTMNTAATAIGGGRKGNGGGGRSGKEERSQFDDTLSRDKDEDNDRPDNVPSHLLLEDGEDKVMALRTWIPTPTYQAMRSATRVYSSCTRGYTTGG